MFKVSFFIKEKEQELFSLLEPLRFSIHRDHKAVWKGQQEESHFIIQPFSIVGRESQGYRAYFNGSAEAFQYLFDSSVGSFSPKISGIEYLLKTEKNQVEFIKQAEQSKIKRGSMYGIYEHKGVGIVILPNGRVTFQIRNRKIKQSDLAKVMMEIESVKSIFTHQDFNLFSVMNYVG